MNKFVVYTSNLGFVPKNIKDVIKFAQQNSKFYIANVELNNHLTGVSAGDNIITKKGNSLYIIKTFDKSIDELSAEDQEYIDELQRSYGLKKVNITSVANRVRYETWCKEAIPVFNKTNNSNKEENNMKKNSSISGCMARLKDTLMPREVKGVRVAQDGNICVETDDGYVTINQNNELISYPKEFTLPVPVYTISKPKAQLQVGDVIALDRSFAKIIKIGEFGKIKAISYTGSGKTIHTIKDFLFNESYVRVVVSPLAGNFGGGINPMMLLALNDGDGEGEGEGKFSKLLPLMLLSQNNGQVAPNNLAMLAFLGDKDGDESSFKDLLMMQAFGAFGGNGNGGGLFGGLFGGQAQPQPQPAPEAKQPEEAKDAEDAED